MEIASSRRKFIMAAENGLRVLVLEKEEHIGGSTRISGGFYSCVDPGRQNALRIRDSEPFFLSQVLQRRPLGPGACPDSGVRRDPDAQVA